METIIEPGHWIHLKGRGYKVNEVSCDMDIMKLTIEPDSADDSPICHDPKYYFPDLIYTNVKEKLSDNGKLSTSVKSMITLLKKKEIVSKEYFDEFKIDDDIEATIIEKIEEYNNEKHKDENKLEEIFHLIQTWGGSAGRGIYLFGNDPNTEKERKDLWKDKWESEIKKPYKDLVNKCLTIKDMPIENINDITEDIIKTLADAVIEFSKVKHINIAFITKHTRFWLEPKLGDNVLPIYDSIMAVWVMRKNGPELRHLEEYWKVMISKAKSLGIGLVPLERHIFKHAYKLLKK